MKWLHLSLRYMYIHHMRALARTHPPGSSGTMRNNGSSLVEEMGKEARYKKRLNNVEHCGGRGAISVRRSPKSVFTNISIWNMVCDSLRVEWGKKNWITPGSVYMQAIISERRQNWHVYSLAHICICGRTDSACSRSRRRRRSRSSIVVLIKTGGKAEPSNSPTESLVAPRRPLRDGSSHVFRPHGWLSDACALLTIWLVG